MNSHVFHPSFSHFIQIHQSIQNSSTTVDVDNHVEKDDTTAERENEDLERLSPTTSSYDDVTTTGTSSSSSDRLVCLYRICYNNLLGHASWSWSQIFYSKYSQFYHGKHTSKSFGKEKVVHGKKLPNDPRLNICFSIEKITLASFYMLVLFMITLLLLSK